MSSSGPRTALLPLTAVAMAGLLMVLRADAPAPRAESVRAQRQFLSRLGPRAGSCLQRLAATGRGAYLAELAAGASTPTIDGVEIGSRNGDIVTVRTGPEGLRALAAHPSVEQIEASRPLKFCSDVSTGATIAVRGTSTPETYTYNAAAGETLTIVAHGEGGVDTDLTAAPAGLVVSANGGPGNDAVATGTVSTSGSATITVTGAPYVLVVRSSRSITVADLVGTGGAAANGVFYLGTGAEAVRTANGIDGAGVAVCIIDTGIDITNPDFQSAPNVTRILSIWDQTIGRAVGESFPAGFSYGAEYSQLQINNHLNGSLPNYVRHLDASGHGTAMAGVAAGNGAASGFSGAAPGSGLIVVRTFGTTSSLLDALTYCRAKALGLGLPCIVALGMGTHDGPHDGTSLLDKGVDSIIAAGNIVVITAAGNSGNAADKVHEQVSLSPFTSKRLQYTPDAAAFSSFDTADHVVISEVMAADGAGSTATQFVELYNPTDRAVDIGLWTIGVQGFDSTIFPLNTPILIPLGTFIAPFSYFLIGTPPGTTANISGVLNLFPGDGHVMLFKFTEEIDRIGYGAADSPEGSAAPPLLAGISLERVPGPSGSGNGGNGTDAGDNSTDFVVRPLPDPQNVNSAPEQPKPPHVIDLWADGGDSYAVKVDEAGGPFLVAADPGTTGVTQIFDASPTPVKIGEYTVENDIDAPANGATHIRVTLIHTAGPPGLPANYGITLIRLGGSGSGVVDGYAGTDIGFFSSAFLAANADGSFPGSVSSPGTSVQAITVGAYVSKFKWDSAVPTAGQEQVTERGEMGGLADFSGRGPTRDGRIKPEVAAPGAWVGTSAAAGVVYAPAMVDAVNPQLVFWGVAPTVGGVSFTGGSSFAAAEVAGSVALVLQKNSAINYQSSVRNLLIQGAVTDSKTSSLGALPNGSWGYGKMSTITIDGFVPQATFVTVRTISCPLVTLSASGGGSPTLALLALTAVAAFGLSLFRSQLHGSPRS